MSRSVEVGHVYRAQLEAADGIDDWQARLEWECAQVDLSEASAVLIFVDDYPGEYTRAERVEVAEQLNDAAQGVGVFPDVIAFESDCAAAAARLGELLPHMEWWVTRDGSVTRHAVLMKEDDYWTCPALAAVWTLARLGVQPYMRAALDGAIRFTDRFDADEILTVLPTTYIGNEAAVVEIVRQLRKPRIRLAKLQYVFT